MVVALTLVPALAARVRAGRPARLRRAMDTALERLQGAYARLTGALLHRAWLPLLVLVPALAWGVQVFMNAEDAFLPRVDSGQVRVRILGDAGMQLDEMDATVRRIEALLQARPEVQSVFTQAGGFVYGRTQWFSGNRSVIRVQLLPRAQRAVSTEQWVQAMRGRIQALDLPGFRVHIWAKAKVQGIRLGRGDEDLSLRIAGPDLTVLTALGQDVVQRLRDVPGLENLHHSYEGVQEELQVRLDRARASDLGVTLEQVGQALRVALDGLVVTDFLDGDRRLDVRLRLPRGRIASPDALGEVIVALRDARPIRLRDLAQVTLSPSPASIMRDRQVRVVEISAELQEGHALAEVMDTVRARLADLELPTGYGLYDDGAVQALKQGQRLGYLLLALAIFLVFVVMAVQYESLRNPLVILLAIPFTLIGVAGGIWYNALPLSMPVWLGMIMLAGIVVNNGIVLVEQIEIECEQGRGLNAAIAQAARARLRPILMTTLTTVVGMTPLALGLGEGSEMLQPLAVVIVWGLAFSTLVSLVLIPTVYRLLHGARPATGPQPEPAG